MAADRPGEQPEHLDASAQRGAPDASGDTPDRPDAASDEAGSGPDGQQQSAADPASSSAAAPPADAEATSPQASSEVGDTDDPASGSSRSGRHRGRRRRANRTPRRKAPWWELPALIVLAIAIAIGVKTWVIQPFYIPSASMEHTLHGCDGCEGDRILVNKTVYYVRDPDPGDIVVFDAPPGWDTEPVSTPPGNPVLRVVRGFGQLIGFVPPDGEVLVKRVIAVGGQTVKGDADGHVMVSDDGPDGHFRTLNEPYVFNDASTANNPGAFGPVTVPKGRLWVMGDHRTDSADSRYHCTPGQLGPSDDLNCNAVSSTVPDDDVIGKAVVIAWPPSRWRTLGTPSTFDAAGADLGAAVVPAAAPVLGTVAFALALRRSRPGPRRRRRP